MYKIVVILFSYLTYNSKVTINYFSRVHYSSVC